MSMASMEPPAARELSPSESVVEAVAAREGVDPVDLDIPLFEALDPDALDTLVRSASAGTDQSSVRVEFTYRGYEVTVTEDGAVEVSRSRAPISK